MTISQLLRVDPGSGPVRLAEIDPRSTPGTDLGKQDAQQVVATLGPDLADLQAKRHAEARTGGRRRVLVVLQGMDTAGKGGAIAGVARLMNPAGLQATSFGAPTPEELSHDFLWRFNRALPDPGRIALFDRSHYEDVLIVRVHDLVPEREWQTRYDRINSWEAELTAQGVVMLKVMLHLSKDEQRTRLLARLADPAKHWKINPGDITERGHWEAYQQAYEVVLERCSTEVAPWHVVPADRKWYRDWALAHLLRETLQKMQLSWPVVDLDLDGMRRALGQS